MEGRTASLSARGVQGREPCRGEATALEPTDGCAKMWGCGKTTGARDDDGAWGDESGDDMSLYGEHDGNVHTARRVRMTGGEGSGRMTRAG